MSKKSNATIESKESPAKALSPLNAALTKDQKIDLYRTMMRIRRFEERSLRAYQARKIGGFLHLYIGQEAVAVGCCSLMGKNDHVITAYRDHGHALGVGMSMNECMAELYGKATGCSKGKGGSMHFFAPDKNYWGGHGIVGGQIPLGIGLAYGLKYKGLKGAAMAFMGDGAVNQGAVHESYNLAALWDLPAVVIIENNGYSMGTSQPRSSAGESLAKRAEGYGMAWDTVNGHDLYDVRDKVNIALERARNESKPTVLEIKTYRYRGHSVADPDQTYRTKEEIEEYRRTKDPITVFQNNLVAEGVLPDELIQAIDTAAREEADRSADFAEQSPYPTIEDITKDVYWEEDNRSEKTTSQGRIVFE
ncbi:MAG TPA: pyruvate dehydrogenase (acetyl-transferring) E1 component subunit alpha [Opitutaceae bacterium]|nr:pyruvate dehydrogenase (acetyl-transferring) E1 component subunit alpha [Opitutaceae bacterium]